MTTRQINVLLWASATALCAAALAVALWGILAPVGDVGAGAAAQPVTTPGNAQLASASLPSLESFAPVWSKPIRRPLVDGQMVASAPDTAAAPIADTSLPVTLVGTIGNSLAMLKLADGSIALKGPGDQVAGVDVLSVRPAAVDIRFAGRTITLNKVNVPPSTGPVDTSDQPTSR